MLFNVFEYQYKYNELATKNWINNRNLRDWLLAIHTEFSEFIDCFDWKWWKNNKIDSNIKGEDILNLVINKKNLLVELSDLLHFVVSFIIQAYYMKNKDKYKNSNDKTIQNVLLKDLKNNVIKPLVDNQLYSFIKFNGSEKHNLLGRELLLVLEKYENGTPEEIYKVLKDKIVEVFDKYL